MNDPDQIETVVRRAVREELANFHSSPPRSEGGYVTIAQTCEMLSISKTTLWQLRREGKLAGHQVGRRVLFRLADVTALVEGTN